MVVPNVCLGGVALARAESLRKDRRRLVHSAGWSRWLRSPRIWRGLYLSNRAGLLWKMGNEADYAPCPGPSPSFPPTSQSIKHPWGPREGRGEWPWATCHYLADRREKVVRREFRGVQRTEGARAATGLAKARSRPGSRARAGGAGGQRRPYCARLALAAHLPAGAGRARRWGAPASRLPPPARGGSGGARCKQSGGRDVSRSHGASYGSGWLSAVGQLRQLLLWLGRRRRGGGRGGSGIGPSALPALSAPRLK